MCGQTASLVITAERGQPDDLGLVERLLSYGGDTIPAGRRIVATSEPWQVLKGAGRAEAVATQLRISNRKLVNWWELAVRRGWPDGTADAFQTGAAAAETMADLLDAILVGDLDAARAVIELFVNDAVDTGVVAV